MTIQFEAGRTYYTRSICDYNCIIAVTVTKRTAKTVTATVNGDAAKTFRPYVSAHYGAEVLRPWGSYSMSPLVDATNTKVLVRS